METRPGATPARDPRPEPDDDRSFDWMQAHAKPGPGLVRHTIPLGLFDPVPPAEPRPYLLVANLHEGDPLELERVEIAGRSRPDFIVRTQQGRDLGRLRGEAAAMIEFARCEGMGVELTVFAAIPYFPPETALLLQLAIVVWCRPDDWVERPVVFRSRRYA